MVILSLAHSKNVQPWMVQNIQNWFDGYTVIGLNVYQDSAKYYYANFAGYPFLIRFTLAGIKAYIKRRTG